MADTESRLSSGNIYYRGEYIPIDEYRSMISARSLYNPDNEYSNTQLFSSRGESNVVDSISTVLNVIPQYNRMQVNTNILGNTYDAFRDNGSPLAKIGLAMLGKQIAYNSAANLSTKYIPSIDITGAISGGKLFKKNINNTITIKKDEDKSVLDKISDVSTNFLGIENYNMFNTDNPFSKDPSKIDYIENTGGAQLTNFFKAINLNAYKPINELTDEQYSNVLNEYADELDTSIISSSNTLESANRRFFNFNDSKLHPYSTLSLSINSDKLNNDASSDILSWYKYASYMTQEYAPTQKVVDTFFGDTKKTKVVKDNISGYVNDVSNHASENVWDNVVWGRDGLPDEVMGKINALRGEEDKNVFDDFPTNIKGGLLNYTKNLLNATEGNMIDITRKAFKKGDEYVGFNGSPLWETNDSVYAERSINGNKYGVRQHTTLDPYDRYTKAIRFNGNELYTSSKGGSTDSVVYKSVLPRIHPTMDSGGINNKNLMFSLENLAVGTSAPPEAKYGIIDDEYGTAIPLSEVGNFGGRLMWFPPYNIEINEVATANYESTVMVGRNEPMYNYMHSERTAVVSFSLLIDVPEQLRNIEYTGENKNKVIADFFAFGGNPIPAEYEIDTVVDKIEALKYELDELGGPTNVAEPPTKLVPQVEFYFPNDKPEVGEENDIINTMFNVNHYEVVDGIESSNDGNGFGLNMCAYFITGLTGQTDNEKWEFPPDLYINQYTATGGSSQDQLNVSILNDNLIDVFSDEEYRKYYDITITGTASALGNTTHNQALGNRRVEAVIELIYRRLVKMFGVEIANGIKSNNIKSVLNIGDSNAGTAGESAENMNSREVKEERCATINIGRNSIPVDKKNQILNSDQLKNKANIETQIKTLETKLNILKRNNSEHNFDTRRKPLSNGFESISDNNYSPAFNSQTPEDFHKRLTFLQQCTRQGAAKRYDVVDDNTGELRASNSVFGKQPICVLRIADFFHTRVIISSVTIDYADAPWDTNPEGHGMQPMMANVTLQMKVIGGQSLKTPINALQNAVSYNYYANSTFNDRGIYAKPSNEANKQAQYDKGILDKQHSALNAAYETLTKDK